MITLYEYALSGNCYKVRQLAAWLGLPLQRVPINLHPARSEERRVAKDCRSPCSPKQ